MPFPSNKKHLSHSSSDPTWKLVLGALGVVFGDIGTSTLYALKECFNPEHGLSPDLGNVLGILSLVFWSLTLVVSIKYLLFIMRADNQGEGGILALLALLLPQVGKGAPANDRAAHARKTAVIGLALVGTALLYGDGVITPAISVLSAMEGLGVATHALDPVIVPATILIIIALFIFQRRGTASVAAIFGPITLLWFLVNGLMGVHWILRRPEVLQAVNPTWAFQFFVQNGWLGFGVLSAVVLCITGGEALYADMGHYGRKPIAIGWFSLVFPCVLLNYFGQGAIILERGPLVIANPFYAMVGGPWLIPVVILATCATVIASQALISGAYSLTQQAVQLGVLPRVMIQHTSRSTRGQIYVPKVNELLMVGCIVLILFFQKSSAIASAYGIAVTGTMVITSLLFLAVARHIWKWSYGFLLPFGALFLLIDGTYFVSNLGKIEHGGWVPILIASVLFAIMFTWRRGRELVSSHVKSRGVPLQEFFLEVKQKNPIRVRGTAVFMTQSPDIAPSVLMHHFKHNRALHERVILCSVTTETVPEISSYERARVTDLDQGFIRIIARYGYMESPDMDEILLFCSGAGLQLDFSKISFYVGRESFQITDEPGMARWRKRLFIYLTRNARTATDYFGIPADQVIEIGSQIRI